MKTKTQICKLCTIFGDGPCSPKCLEAAEEKAARAIHAEHNRHEGLTTPWVSLHKFQRMKYRAKAYAVLVALGAPKKAAAPRRSNK
jgi:hypothetical protein